MNKKRNYGVDLLRIILMFMVCLQHILKIGGVLGSLSQASIEYRTYYFLYILSLCAVNGFAIISGYMASDTPQKYNKIIDMWFQAFFYSFILTVFLSIAEGGMNLGIKELIKCALPITFNKFWYFTAYVGLFFAIPILNKFLFTLDEEKAKTYFVVTVILFTFIGVPTDAFKTNWGYSALWLMILYCVGVFAKIGRLFENKNTISLVIFLFISTFIAWGCSVFLSINIFLDYISPVMLINGLLMVIIFSRFKIKGTIISKISPLVFGVYLFHLNQIVWESLGNICTFVTEKNIFIGLVYVFIIVFIIFILGLGTELIRKKIAKVLKLHVLSEKIVALADKLLNKLCVILK